MFLIILLFVLFVGAITLTSWADYEGWDGVGVFGGVLSILFLFGFLFFGVCAIFTQVNVKPEYEAMVQERKVIEYRLYKEDDITGNDDLYSCIVAFNSKVVESRTMKDNLFVNWFYNPLLADLELIEVK